MKTILALILAGLSVGLGNFAASVAIGLAGVDKKIRLKMALVFGVFETGMPIIGLIIGRQIAGRLGSNANWIGGGLLILTGLYILYEAVARTKEKEVSVGANNSFGKLILAGLALSVDNLIIGFGLGTHHQNIAEAAVIIGATSIALALLGLEIGNRASTKLEEYSEAASGVILVIVGFAIALKLLG